MNKKLIALAVAAAIAPAAAMADSGNVTIYGVADVSYDITDNGNTATTNGIRTNKVSSNSSRLGFKGTEDLGNGLSAIWQLETGINFDGTTAADLNSRNTFVGLSSKTAGTALLGKHDTPYKLATRSLDVFGDGLADNRSIMGGGAGVLKSVALPDVFGTGVTSFNTLDGYGSAVASFDGRQKDVVAYISPTISGFHAAVAYVAGAEGAATSGQSKGSAWSLAGLYDNGPFFASLAYEKHSFGNAAGDLNGSVYTVDGADLIAIDAKDRSEKAWKLGLGYKTNVFRVGFAYEKTSDDLGNSTGSCTTIATGVTCGTIAAISTNADVFGHKAYYLGGGYKVTPNNEIKLAYTKAGDRGNQSNTGASQWALGVDHMMSKRTKVYALYTKLSNDTDAAYNLGQGTGVVNPKGDGADPTAWSFGMRHTF